MAFTLLIESDNLKGAATTVDIFYRVLETQADTVFHLVVLFGDLPWVCSLRRRYRMDMLVPDTRAVVAILGFQKFTIRST